MICEQQNFYIDPRFWYSLDYDIVCRFVVLSLPLKLFQRQWYEVKNKYVDMVPLRDGLLQMF